MVPAVGSANRSTARSARYGHVGTGVAHVRVRVGIVNVIERIVHVGPDFESDPFVKGNSFPILMFTFAKPGPIRVLRPLFPKVPGNGLAKAAGLNHL